jgi:hypothetical protein
LLWRDLGLRAGIGGAADDPSDKKGRPCNHRQAIAAAKLLRPS